MTEQKDTTTRVTTGEYFGACPECGGHDGYFNIRRDHWFACHRHKVMWLLGSNLFSSWRDETEEQWQANAEMLASYEVINPIMPEPTEEERKEMETHRKQNAEARRIDKGYGVICSPDGMRALEKGEDIFFLDDGIPF